jgi:hypothetical protein
MFYLQWRGFQSYYHTGVLLSTEKQGLCLWIVSRTRCGPKQSGCRRDIGDTTRKNLEKSQESACPVQGCGGKYYFTGN